MRAGVDVRMEAYWSWQLTSRSVLKRALSRASACS